MFIYKYILASNNLTYNGLTNRAQHIFLLIKKNNLSTFKEYPIK